MKTILFSVFFSLCFTLSAFSQTVNGVPISEIDVEYVRIVGEARLLSTKVKVHLEFGQHNKWFKDSDTKIMDSDGKALILNSMVDALNFMDKAGYEFISAYAVQVDDRNVYHYLMRRKKS